MEIALRYTMALAMMGMGVLHFVAPRAFAAIVPRALPAPVALVYISGVFEFAGGVGLLVPSVQRLAAFGLIALFVAVFPANVNMAIHRIPAGKAMLPDWALWGRLPVQLLLIWWAWWLAKVGAP